MSDDYYACKDRQGIVHLAWQMASSHRWDDDMSYPDDDYPVDRTLCEESNYMDKTIQAVTCLMCLGESFRRAQEEERYGGYRR